jgi:hypothetical protein
LGYEIRPILETINEGFMLIGTAQTAAEVKDGVVIFKWEITEV